MPDAKAALAFHHPLAFWAGTAAIVLGVALHLPMLFHALMMGCPLAGMAMDGAMLAGMALILGGTLGAGYGLFPRRTGKGAAGNESVPHLRDLDDAALTPAHATLFFALLVALIIDVMKPATLGFVLAGVAQEYGLSRAQVAMLPFVALTGTTIGSLVWGFLGDAIGRRASILLAALMFIGTSICGAMPSFSWNLVMCFLMGCSAGGLLPIAFALLVETVPARHRGWLVVLLGGAGAAGGYLAAAGSAALLEPHFGWRILWILGLPTGLLLLALNRYIPESPRFLVGQGRGREARAVMARFGAVSLDAPAPAALSAKSGAGVLQLFRSRYSGLTLGLTLCGIAWGLVNFGFLLWLPTNLRSIGFDGAQADAVLAKSALIAFPGVLLVTWLYHRWSSLKTLVLFALLTAAALLAFPFLAFGPGSSALLVFLTVALLISSSGVIAMLLPYAAEVYPVGARATGAGLVAASSKLGGLAGVGIGLAALAPGLGTAAVAVAVPVALSGLLMSRSGVETRGLRLEEIEAARP